MSSRHVPIRSAGRSVSLLPMSDEPTTNPIAGGTMHVILAALITLTTPHPAARINLPVASRDAVAVRVALDDATIVAIYDAANTADIETGGLGAKRGSTQKIRDFGAM